MSFRSLELEDFGKNTGRIVLQGIATADVETIRLEGYDAGYKLGWGDANAEREKSESRIAVDLERNLADLAYSYQEARAEVISGLSSLFSSILSSFLPAVASEAVVPLVMAELDAIAADIGEGKCQLKASPTTAKQLIWLRDTYMEVDLGIHEEPAYPDGRVSLFFGEEAREIDLSKLTQQTASAIREFTAASALNEEIKHA